MSDFPPPHLAPLTRSELLALAPARLHSYRHGRYTGESERVRLNEFAVEDQQLLFAFYQSLLDLYGKLKPFHTSHSDCRGALQAYVETPDYLQLMQQVTHFGHATAAHKGPVEVGRLVHDLRGGAFQALAFRLQLFCYAPEKTKGLESIYFLVRDHLKIMRNCVSDLDPPQFAADSESRAHGVDLLAEKWDLTELPGKQGPVRVAFDCQFDGTLCESCLEFASLDRVIYNLMNNAARHALDGVVHLSVLAVPDSAGEDVRFVVANRVSEEQRQLLTDHFGTDLSELFRGGFTTGGHGLGARICADFCAHSYGIFDFAKAKHAGYFGACWISDYFVAWFHWPRVGR